MLNAEIDLFQGVTSWARDLVIGVVWLINPFHWDDAIKGGIYSVTHISEVVPAIMDEVKTTYEEQGLVYCVGYVIPEVLAYFYGAGEAKAVSNLEKIDDIPKLGKYTGVEIAEGVETTAGVLEVGEATERVEVILETEAIAIEIETVSIDELPKNVQESYKNYTEYTTKKGNSPWNNNAKPNGGKAGSAFNNEPPILPEGEYIEYDVNSPGNKGRDGQRFVRNKSTGEVYYTADNYNTFLKIGE